MRKCVDRFGTCGGLSADAPAGTIVVASMGSGYVNRNPDAFMHTYLYSSNESAAVSTNTMSADVSAYRLHNVAPAHEPLSTLLYSELSSVFDTTSVVQGMNVTADSFYSSQGRMDDSFDDNNSAVIDAIIARYPDAKTLEMETFQLLHLAQCSIKQPIIASAAAIVVANRLSAEVVDADTFNKLEDLGGKAVLDAIVKIEL